jgi:hypothetical protein
MHRIGNHHLLRHTTSISWWEDIARWWLEHDFHVLHRAQHNKSATRTRKPSKNKNYQTVRYSLPWEQLLEVRNH